MPLSVVQSKRAAQAASLTGTVTLDNPVTPGNALICAYRESDGTATITLPGGFSWSPTHPIGPPAKQGGVFSKVAPDATQTFQVSSNVADTKTLVMVELNLGGGVFNRGAGNESTNDVGVVTQSVGSTGQLPQAECYVITCMNLSGSSGGTNAIDSGFTLLQTAAGLSDTFLAGDKITAVDTALNPTYTWLTARTAQGYSAVFYATPVQVFTLGGMARRPRHSRRRW